MDWRSQKNSESGFTLIELSIVIVVLALIMASILTVLANETSRRKRLETLDRIEKIQSALLSYRKLNNRLPCPANYTYAASNANFGIEAANLGTCTGGTPAAPRTSGNTRAGAVPTKTLGLPDTMQFDAWGGRFYYAVDVRLTAANAFSSYEPKNSSIGSITVRDATGASRTTQASVALVSHGPNGHGAYQASGSVKNASSTNTDEQQNCDCNASAAATAYNAIYVQKPFTSSSASVYNTFDDIVSYMMRSQMLTADEMETVLE